MLIPRARSYLLTALAATPDIITGLVDPALPASGADRRIDPERFTIREILAHLADWNTIYHDRLVQMRDQDSPVIVSIDEGQRAIDHDYAHIELADSLERFRQSRQELVQFFNGLSDTQWQRAGKHAEYGQLDMENQLALIVGHDSYHLQEIAQLLQ